MSGKVPPSSRAGKFKPRRDNVERAVSLFERFTGHDAVSIGVWKVPDVPDTLAVIGPVDFIGYTTVRDGETEKYIHRFKASDRPLLAIAPDGTQIFLVGGRYIFTERGIVDLSDTKNLPPELRAMVAREMRKR